MHHTHVLKIYTKKCVKICAKNICRKHVLKMRKFEKFEKYVFTMQKYAEMCTFRQNSKIYTKYTGIWGNMHLCTVHFPPPALWLGFGKVGHWFPPLALCLCVAIDQEPLALSYNALLPLGPLTSWGWTLFAHCHQCSLPISASLAPEIRAKMSAKISTNKSENKHKISTK